MADNLSAVTLRRPELVIIALYHGRAPELIIGKRARASTGTAKNNDNNMTMGPNKGQ